MSCIIWLVLAIIEVAGMALGIAIYSTYFGFTWSFVFKLLLTVWIINLLIGCGLWMSVKTTIKGE